MLYGSVPIHTVIIGDNATGKTTAIKKLFQEIREQTIDCTPVYINCRKHYTEYQVYGEIYKHIFQKEAPQRGSNSRKIITDIMKYLEISKQPLLVALDDANYLLGDNVSATPHSQNIIQQLTRANESYNIIIGIYPIITNNEFKYKFEQEVSTLFTPREVYLHDYTPEEYTNIIKERCQHAFNIKIQEKVIKQIVEEVTRTRNIRLAWHLLKVLGLELNINPNSNQEEIMKKIIEQ